MPSPVKITKQTDERALQDQRWPRGYDLSSSVDLPSENKEKEKDSAHDHPS